MRERVARASQRRPGRKSKEAALGICVRCSSSDGGGSHAGVQRTRAEGLASLCARVTGEVARAIYTSAAGVDV